MSLKEKPLIVEPTSKNCFISVVIPVRDEAEYLQKTLESFSNQKNLQHSPLGEDIFELIILLNNCRDNSENIARSFKSENEELNLHICKTEIPAENCNSGFVRRLLMNAAFQRLTRISNKGGIIMTTDGDTQVANNWIAANIYEIENGADAVGGRILFSEMELAVMNSAARRFHLIDEKYRLLIAELESLIDFLPHDSAPRHHQHFNGSFAVTTEIYEKAGGIPDVRYLEDVAFYQALMRIDAKFRHSPLVKVYTSARNDGRTEAGLSTQINDWKMLAERNEDFFVESAEAIEIKLKAQNKMRQIWLNMQKNESPGEPEITRLAKEFCISCRDLEIEIEKPQTFGKLLENVYRLQFETGDWNNKYKPIAVSDAVAELEKSVEKLRSKSKSKTVAL